MIAEDFSDEFVIAVAIVLVLEMVVGLVANVAVLIISRYSVRQRWERGNNFNFNLHVVDSIICVTIVPLTLTYVLSTRFQTPLFCYVFEGAVSFASTASSLTLFFICLDRYYAVMAPTDEHIIASKPTLFIIFVWVLAVFAFFSPFFGIKMDMFDRWSQEDVENVTLTLTCSETIWRMEPHYFHEVFYVVSFLLTAFAMVMFYLSITRVTRRRVAIKEALVKASLSFGVNLTAQKEAERKTLKLSLAIVFAFLFFWGPHLIMTVVGMASRGSLAIDIAQILCLVFAFVTTIIHPLLYAFMRQRFREALHRRWNRKTSTNPEGNGKIATIEVRSPDES